MSSPSPSSLDSVGTSPLGSYSDPNEHPLLALDLGLGPLVGYGDNGVFGGCYNNSSSASSSYSSYAHNSALSLYLNGLGSANGMESGSTLKDNLSVSSSGTSSRPPSGGMPGCNSSSTSSSGVSSPGLATKCAVCGIGDSYSVMPKVLPCLHALCQQCWDKQQQQQCSEGTNISDLLDKSAAGCCPVCKADCLLSPPSSSSTGSNNHQQGSSMFTDFSSSSSSMHNQLSGAFTTNSILGSSSSSNNSSDSNSSLLETNNWNSATCTACKAKDAALAVAKCFDCASLLCPSCVLAHQFMHCFEGHRLMTLAELANPSSSSSSSSSNF